MTKKTLRRYIYEENEKEITEWAEKMVHEQRMMRPPNGKANFPFYLQQYINHLKFEARKSR